MGKYIATFLGKHLSHPIEIENTYTNNKHFFFQLPANACFKPEPAALMQRDNKIAIKTTR
jgi:hypothetical protein